MSDTEFVHQKMDILEDMIESHNQLIQLCLEEEMRMAKKRGELEVVRDELMAERESEESMLFGTGE